MSPYSSLQRESVDTQDAVVEADASLEEGVPKEWGRGGASSTRGGDVRVESDDDDDSQMTASPEERASREVSPVRSSDVDDPQMTGLPEERELGEASPACSSGILVDSDDDSDSDGGGGDGGDDDSRIKRLFEERGSGDSSSMRLSEP